MDGSEHVCQMNFSVGNITPLGKLLELNQIKMDEFDCIEAKGWTIALIKFNMC